MFRTQASRARARERGRLLARQWIEDVGSQVRKQVKMVHFMNDMSGRITEAQKSLPHMTHERRVRWLGNMFALAGVIDPGW